MKRFYPVMLFIAMAAIGLSASAADLNGSRYQGIAKIKGQPIDCWVDLLFDDTDIEVNVAETYKFAAGYTAETLGDKLTVTAKVAGGQPTTLTSTDGGSTLQGKITLNGRPLDVWVLKVPATLTAADKSAPELEAVIGDSDGYSAFVLIGLPDGQLMCATSDFAFDGASKSFKMTCDTPAIQKIFGTMQGSYSIEGSRIVMTDATGKTVAGTVYDDGYYIKVPMGSAQGITLSLVLIK